MSSTKQDDEHNIAARVNLSPPSKGSTVWHAKQVNVVKKLVPPGKAPKSRHDFEWSSGPVKLRGYVDTDDWEIGVEVFVLGINLGVISGNLKDGVRIDVDLLMASGEMKLYLMNGNELWVRVDIKVKFDGKFHDDFKITAF